MWAARDFGSAVRDFHDARRRAALEEIMARFTGQSAELLSYEDVRQKLRATGGARRGLREIPITSIVGSVGRYADFTRSFLPKQKSDIDRWAMVDHAFENMDAMPAIEVYQIGEAYFVLDGNHRVSIARRKGLKYITAEVTEINTAVPLSPADQPEDLIIKAEAAAFLEYTRLDQVCCSGSDLAVSIPGQYAHLENHIEVHRYFSEEERGREIPLEEAAADWYTNAYLPVVQAIREQDILQDFPGRTETDLYLWLSQHRVAIRNELGMDVKPEAGVAELAARFNPRPERVVARLARKALNAVMRDKLDAGPPPGQWRKEHLVTHRAGRLFDDLLVAIGVGSDAVVPNADEADWSAVDQAIDIARREQARVFGFCAPDSESPSDMEKARAVETEFNRRCQAAGLESKLVFQAGQVAGNIAERSWWVDLIVLSRSVATALQPQTPPASDLRAILRTSARPVLTVPGSASPLSRALLAYDGSPRAEEALFVATYLAERWAMPLVVLTVETDRVKPGTHKRAQDYLAEHGVSATFVRQRGPVVPEILIVAEEHACDWIIMGSYGPNLFEAAHDSTVDDLLRASRQPVLICR